MTRWLDPTRTPSVLRLAGPIIGGMASQTILNLVDAAMVGGLGPAAQAGVGLGSLTFFVLANLVLCLGTGVQTLVSRRDGEGRTGEAGATLDTSLAFVTGIAVPLGLALSLVAPLIFSLLSSDPAVVDGGGGYLQIRLMALGVVTANYCFRGFYNGIGRSRTYMQTLLVIHALNIGLNWVLIYGHLGAPAMGVRGAALASAIAPAIGTLLYVIFTWADVTLRTTYRPFRFAGIDRRIGRALVRLSWPEALRGIGLMLGYLLFLRLHSAIGTREAAAGTILVQLASVGFLPALGFGMAGATLVGRALGANDVDEARRSVWQIVRLALTLVLAPALLLQVAPDLVLSIFTRDGVVIELARPAIRLLGLSFLIDVLPFVLITSLIGAGATRWAAAVQVGAQYVLLLPLAWLLGIALSWGVFGLWIAMVIARATLGFVALRRFQGTSWERIAV